MKAADNITVVPEVVYIPKQVQGAKNKYFCGAVVQTVFKFCLFDLTLVGPSENFPAHIKTSLTWRAFFIAQLRASCRNEHCT